MRGHRIHHVNGQETAETIVNGVAERQKPGLAEQNVVRKGKNDRYADQAERRERAARREDQGQYDQRDAECENGRSDHCDRNLPRETEW